jgi:hypothetical protein
LTPVSCHRLAVGTSVRNNYPKLSIADLKQGFADVQQVAVTTRQYCMPYENDVPIFLCRGIKMLIKQAWPQTKVIQ